MKFIFKRVINSFNRIFYCCPILSDPQLKPMLTNACNFYHEKTGKWISPMDDIDPELGKEFVAKYNNTFPQSFWNWLDEEEKIQANLLP